jgi:hypothetical protein
LQTSSDAELWDRLTTEAASESALWAEALLPRAAQRREAVFSGLCDPAYALGVETIYEGYLLHYGAPRLFSPGDRDTALLLGDYLYAHGLVRVAQTGNVAAVHDLAELISLCAQARAAGNAAVDASVWAATCATLGEGLLDGARLALREHGDGTVLDELASLSVGTERVARAAAVHATFTTHRGSVR